MAPNPIKWEDFIPKVSQPSTSQYNREVQKPFLSFNEWVRGLCKYQCPLCKRTNFLHAKAFWVHIQHKHKMTERKFLESFGKTDFVQHRAEIVCMLCKQGVLHDYIILQRHFSEHHDNISLKEYYLSYIAAEEDGPTLHSEDHNKEDRDEWDQDKEDRDEWEQDKEDHDKEVHDIEDFDEGDHDVEGLHIQHQVENDKEAGQGEDKVCGNDSSEDSTEDFAISSPKAKAPRQSPRDQTETHDDDSSEDIVEDCTFSPPKAKTARKYPSDETALMLSFSNLDLMTEEQIDCEICGCSLPQDKALIHQHMDSIHRINILQYYAMFFDKRKTGNDACLHVCHFCYNYDSLGYNAFGNHLREYHGMQVRDHTKLFGRVDVLSIIPCHVCKQDIRHTESYLSAHEKKHGLGRIAIVSAFKAQLMAAKNDKDLANATTAAEDRTMDLSEEELDTSEEELESSEEESRQTSKKTSEEITITEEEEANNSSDKESNAEDKRDMTTRMIKYPPLKEILHDADLQCRICQENLPKDTLAIHKHVISSHGINILQYFTLFFAQGKRCFDACLYSCFFCKNFSSLGYADYRNHMNWKHGKTTSYHTRKFGMHNNVVKSTITCPICEKEIAHASETVARHARNLHGKESADGVFEAFKRKLILEASSSSASSRPSPSLHECQFCKETFENPNLFKKHLDLHISENLQDALRQGKTASSPASYKCPLCKKSQEFREMDLLKSHLLRVHHRRLTEDRSKSAIHASSEKELEKWLASTCEYMCCYCDDKTVIMSAEKVVEHLVNEHQDVVPADDIDFHVAKCVVGRPITCKFCNEELYNTKENMKAHARSCTKLRSRQQNSS